jgi:putative endonuclease
MAWFLYLIECEDGSVYTGITTDVDARFAAHASGTGARYTRSRKPQRVLASFELADRASASRAEYRVKQLTAAQKRALAAGERTLESVLPAVSDAVSDTADDVVADADAALTATGAMASADTAPGPVDVAPGAAAAETPPG